MPPKLNPSAVAAIFGRRSRLLSALRIDRLTPVQRILLMTCTYVSGLIIGTSIEGTFFPSARSALGVGLLNEAWTPHHNLGLPILYDPVSLLAVAATFLTPFICLRQGEAMAEMIGVHRQNIGYRDSEVDWNAVGHATSLANRRFAAIGTRRGSVIALLVAMALVLPLLSFVRSVGPLVEFRPQGVSPTQWYQAVHRAWWANSLDAHPLGYLMLDTSGVLLYYYVVKQLALGVVFTDWIRAITSAGFGVFPNLTYNSDGYWGMRVVRRLFQWTYASALLHLTLSLLVIMLWLPVGRATIAIAATIVVADGLFVVYPTMTTLRAVTAERSAYVRHLRQRYESNPQSCGDFEHEVDAVWQRPMLPFRLRASGSAIFLYLLIPTVVAVLGNRLGK